MRGRVEHGRGLRLRRRRQRAPAAAAAAAGAKGQQPQQRLGQRLQRARLIHVEHAQELAARAH